VEPLIALLKDKSKYLRKEAAWALGKIGDRRAVEPLIVALKDYYEEGLRKAAAEALGNIGDPRAGEPLIAALKDPNKDVRWAAAKALDKFNWTPGTDDTGVLYWIAKREWNKVVAIGATAVEPLIAALEDGNEHVRWAAIEALVAIGERAVEPLIAALEDGNEHVRWAAAWALGKIGDPRAGEPLIVALKDEDKDMRKAAIEALGKIGDPRAMQPLIEALKDPNRDVRWEAAEALDKFNWTPGTDDTGVLYWIAKEEWDKAVAIGVPAIYLLIAALHWYDKKSRISAARILVALYHSGTLDDDAKRRILNERARITYSHDDYANGCGGHRDKGIGVDFPL
jgi:HEAT repeat protein